MIEVAGRYEVKAKSSYEGFVVSEGVGLGMIIKIFNT